VDALRGPGHVELLAAALTAGGGGRGEGHREQQERAGSRVVLGQEGTGRSVELEDAKYIEIASSGRVLVHVAARIGHNRPP
jgi:hypothetical protein